MATKFPYYTKGPVVKGFGRGSKQLGIPTANFPEDIVKDLNLNTGVYYGYGLVVDVDDAVPRKMVMSIGWNPFYNNTKKSMETHLMHKYGEDFYGKELRVVILGYLRGEKNFASLEALIEAINEDIRQADELLERPEFVTYKNDNFFL